jgi:hypothetical protein
VEVLLRCPRHHRKANPHLSKLPPHLPNAHHTVERPL